MPKASAGILLYRTGPDGLMVLLGHPGGPFWAKKHEGVWSVIKGEIDQPDADPFEVAVGEFAEETGHELHTVADGDPIPLGEVTQRSGKVVAAWAVPGDLDPAMAHSEHFEMEWPPRSGRTASFPEIDEVRWVGLVEAAKLINPAQIPFLTRLVEALG